MEALGATLEEVYVILSGGKCREPNPVQRVLAAAMADLPVARLLLAPTGSGKTEAVLYPALRVMAGERTTTQRTRLIMVYPARSLLEDQAERIACALQRAAAHTARRWSYVLDYGGRKERWEIGDDGDAKRTSGYHHYFGEVILTTLDSFLYRVFGFGLPGKSYIFPHRIFGDPRRTIVCFDEAHSYDEAAFTNFVRLVETLYGNDASVICMTATMPEEYRQMLPFKDDEVIDAVSPGAPLAEQFIQWQTEVRGAKTPDRRLHVVRDAELYAHLPPKSEAEAEAREHERIARVERIVAEVEQRWRPGRRMIVAVERVKSAIEVWKRLKARDANRPLFLYHGRLAPEWRREVYARLKRADRGETDGGYLLVTTSAIEVGCDLNAERLITECCFPEQLIQRAGRCNRRGDVPDAEVVVVGERPSMPFREALKGEAEEAFREALGRELFDAEGFRRAIRREAELDYRTQMLFDMLYAYVYEFDLEYARLHAQGLVVTRSWEPTVTLVAVPPEQVGKPDAPIPERMAIEVPLSWLRGGEEAVAQTRALEPAPVMMRRVYTDVRDEAGHERRRRIMEPLPPGNYAAWKSDLVVQVPIGSCFYPDDAHGYAELPALLSGGPSSRDPYTMEFYYQPPGERRMARLWYSADAQMGERVEEGALIV